MVVTGWNVRHAGQGDPGLAAAAARPPPVGARAESGPFSWRSRNGTGGRVARILEERDTLILRVEAGWGTGDAWSGGLGTRRPARGPVPEARHLPLLHARLFLTPQNSSEGVTLLKTWPLIWGLQGLHLAFLLSSELSPVWAPQGGRG